MTVPVGTAVFAGSAGLATFFAPCAFPLLPGYVGFYLSHSERSTVASALPAALAAAAGALVALAAVASAIAAVGHPIASRIAYLEPVVGVVLIVAGALMLAGRSPTVHLPLPRRPRSLSGFAVFGAGYAVAAAGCVVPVVAGVVAQALTLPSAWTAATLGIYAGGVAAPLVGVTLLSAAGVETWRDLGGRVGDVERLAGVVMVVAGLGQLALSYWLLA